MGVRDALSLALVGTVGLAALPQMLVRTDSWHAAAAAIPALVVIWVLIAAVETKMSTAAGKLVLVLSATIVLAMPELITAPETRVLQLPHLRWRADRTGGLPDVFRGRPEVMAFIQQNSSPTDEIFIGMSQHRLVYANETDLYYLSNRRSATRYMQFEPGAVTRLEVQQEMVRDLDRKKTHVAVLSSCCPFSGEPNESRKPGAALLDGYLRSHYQLVKQVGPYRMLLRNVE